MDRLDHIRHDISAGDAAARQMAMDTLTHALEFFEPPGALQAWRAALYERRLTLESEVALARLVEYVDQQTLAARTAAGLCPCLERLAQGALASK